MHCLVSRMEIVRLNYEKKNKLISCVPNVHVWWITETVSTTESTWREKKIRTGFLLVSVTHIWSAQHWLCCYWQAFCMYFVRATFQHSSSSTSSSWWTTFIIFFFFRFFKHVSFLVHVRNVSVPNRFSLLTKMCLFCDISSSSPLPLCVWVCVCGLFFVSFG